LYNRRIILFAGWIREEKEDAMSNSTIGWNPSTYGLDRHGLENLGTIYFNLPTPQLYEQAIRRREGLLAHLGPLVVRTGHHTGRSPHDRFVVREPTSESRIWWGTENRPFEPEAFDRLFYRLTAYLQGRDIFVQDVITGADPKYRLPVRVITETAWHSLFARTMFVRPDWSKGSEFVPEFAVIDAPGFRAIPELDGTNSEAFILVHFGKKVVIIGGTFYAGEIKKSVFSYMNYHLPLERVLSMHCSANMGESGEVAIFFGLSGTGKTTLSASPDRRLIGDDEHGWSDTGVFDFEGGCYAKVIRLSSEGEPEIYEATRRFGTILENVAIDPVTRRTDLDDASLTENTRAAYPVTHIPNAVAEGRGGHPNHIIMLTLDAFGILPPVARLSPAQAQAHFMAGYTAKVAGTEAGVGKEPMATFSACFGAPFMTLPPTVYARLLGEKIASHEVSCWLVNTGWCRGPFGTGERIHIAYSRAIVRSILSGNLNRASFRKDPTFHFDIPDAVEGVPSELLDPRSAWQDPSAYDAKAKELYRNFLSTLEPYREEMGEILHKAGF